MSETHLKDGFSPGQSVLDVVYIMIQGKAYITATLVFYTINTHSHVIVKKKFNYIFSVGLVLTVQCKNDSYTKYAS